ncbi:hypothetical protein KQ247_11045 [Ruegeria pomeroyi]|uniref:DUF1344 domain-containing protein n=2 Tax=Ruegeria pomeroyi TaxID=89184 RepID=Q5LW64_RUEPO|nr:hypothetical protein [Ruegeria pomeroyi]HCE72753.1 hypothetical protein [Ruegeria sp.]AAV93796.1 hypothetical protein SPO0478 [Ruegeria pomeroyi DSS-3]NVK98651.1 hypothetical protein [Ruegeria pomeroyi]NVL03886.1 hypothetical protein [Ruegeria pomeroyi]QWV07385.1 hypothetical protein KQ247_11045 [Ruegeria pomeroyi]
MRSLLFAATLFAAATPVLADEVTGIILAYDRVDGRIVLEDKTVWSLEFVEEIPEGLAVGDEVRIVFEAAGEDGITKINAIHQE